ncbi:symmetrical bis(5'-nucleosyl)-tetraphosphatase [Alteromonas oceanisediminis]|uniref:symmetrical bis(5'-nucleosyl)-tetraphosphatase n=1 Tax=Alteromonas oceanisediminis TaxID=2836180 RepID=UPI001BD9630D|nr:symmetrical bis(5'-nucleosyl)-tetraphosphatase [Alteromonas oceanisediminis]MBT0585230.1 symmetrical bis(5'-nucleosyl)-tetraphosphatase [Alteromonas oceanisediminis]
MSSYVVGDIQGCYKGLCALLKKINFNANTDTLWAVGDLVARGDDSLSTLQYLYNLGDAFKPVLGNHDLHLLAIASGIKSAKPSDNLKSLLASPERDNLLNWLRQQPLARLIEPNTLMVHAGLYPRWSFAQCLANTDLVSKVLQSSKYTHLLQDMYSSEPRIWADDLPVSDKHRFTINACTRMRYVGTSCALDFSHKDKPSKVPSALKPWFACANQQLLPEQRVMFGHWAALNGVLTQPQFIGLDTGYVWGGKMTCIRLEDSRLFASSAPR